MHSQADPVLNARAATEAAALVTRIEAEIGSFVETLTKQFGAHQDLESLLRRLHEREAEAEHLKTLLVKARMDLEAAKADLNAEREGVDAMRAEAERMTAAFERALDEMRREHADLLSEQTAACTALPLDELLTVFHAMTKASTTDELLSALVTGLAREFSRVALFRIDGARLVAAKRHGFSDDDTSKPIRLPADSLLTRAVSTGRIESLILRQVGAPAVDLPFGGTPGCALALPIVEDRAIAAVIYADDSDYMEFATGAPQARVKFAELVHQHATLLMVRMSVEKVAPQDLRRFAASLVALLEFNYTAEAESGRNQLECQQRLKAAVQAARRRYAQRVKGDSAGAGLLDEQLASTMTAKKDTAFGRDLESVIGGRSRGGRSSNVVAISRSR